MITKFKLVGLQKPNKFNCEFKKEQTFWAKSDMSQDRFNALFDYAKWNWKDKKMVEVKHEGFEPDGRPINPLVLFVLES